MAKRTPYSQREKGGMAILMVVTAIAICMVIVNEFGTRTTIDTLQARNNLDQMRAHFLAQSSLNVTNLVLRLQKRLDTAGANAGPDSRLAGLKGVQLTDYADMLMGAFGGSAQEVEDAIGLSADDAKGLGSSIGSFRVFIKPIDGKINLNCAKANGPNQKLLRNQLASLLYPPAFDSIFEEEDAEGWRRDRKTQIDAIIDYIDDNLDRADTPGAPEDYGYEGLRDKYKAKNQPLDSVEELKLVRGVDDRFWTLFGNSFRVAGSCKVNLRALDDPKVIVSLIALSVKDENDPILNNYPALYALAELVIQGKTMGYYFTETKEFVDFLKDPAAAMMASVTGGAGATTAPTAPAGLQLPGGITGIELNETKLKAVAESKPIGLYDVEVYGEVTRGGILNPLRRTIHATWDQDFQLQQSRVATKLGKDRIGAWLYLREE